jgi:hypothetical protein
MNGFRGAERNGGTFFAEPRRIEVGTGFRYLNLFAEKSGNVANTGSSSSNLLSS